MIYAILFGALLALVVCFVLLIGQQARIRALESRLGAALEAAEGFIHRATEAETVALANAAEWLKRQEAKMRSDAIKRSEYVLKGKVAEQIAPFLDAFEYDPRDCRFLGSPVDYVVFDGMTEGVVERIVLVEIKTGRSRLSGRERQVQTAVECGEMDYEVIRIEK